jgi:DNA-binding XRE family transcriptional regulator
MFLSRDKLSTSQISANFRAHKDLLHDICRARCDRVGKPCEWHVGDVVRKLREERGWSQAFLAKKAGIGRQAVGKVEENVPGQRKGNLPAVASALGYTEPELYALVPRRTVIEPRHTSSKRVGG